MAIDSTPSMMEVGSSAKCLIAKPYRVYRQSLSAWCTFWMKNRIAAGVLFFYFLKREVIFLRDGVGGWGLRAEGCV